MNDTTKVNNWSFPFKPKEGKLDPIQHLTAMAKAGGGYYPIGKNGQWHGGIHFDDKTAAVFDQSQVCCIADGEVIAYRIDKSYPKNLYLNSSKTTFSAPFSRCFVLVKHRLEAPELPPREGVTPVPPPSLIFFSLYMHLLDWDSYSKTGAPAAPAFMGNTLYSVKPDKAVDSMSGLRVRTAPKDGAVTALLPKGTKVRVAPDTASSDWRKLLSIVEGRAIPALTGEDLWVYIKEMQAVAGEPNTFLVADDANDKEPSLAPQKGLNVRKTGSGKGSDPKTGLLPVGAKFSLKAGTTAYRELQQIIEGQDVLPLSANSVHNIKGFVHFSSLDTSRSEPVLNQVHVLPKPYPIKAGELIGYLGQYQNYDEGSAKPLLHLEVFSCEDVPGFIAKSRTLATGLPDQQKTLLKVYKGASKLIPHREDISVSNPPKTSDAGTTVGVDLIIPQSLLDALPADHKLQVSTTVPGSSTPVVNRWWRLNNLLADSSGNPISGWLAEQEPITTRHSPWEWMGYDFIKETGRPIGKATYFYDVLRRLTDEERANYRALVSQEDQGPVKTRLYDIIDTNRDNKLTATEIRNALAKPWHAQSIAQLITRYESEWFWKADKWDELDPLMGHIPYVDPNQNWESEKYRIEQLSWWESLKGKDGISADGIAWHFQPAWLTTNFSKGRIRRRRDYDLGALSSAYETGGRGSKTVSGGSGDAGGASYGSYQMTSQVTLPNGTIIIGGTVKKFINWSGFPWTDEFEGLTPGSSEFTQKWKDLIDEHTDEFTEIEHEFIKITHYDIQINKVFNDTGIDLRYHSHTMNDVVWSTAVQQGPGASIIINAIKSINIDNEETKAYDSALIDAIYSERGRRIVGGVKDGQLFYFSKNSINTQEGVAARFVSERTEAQELLRTEDDY